MHITKAVLATAAAVCLTLSPIHAAEPGDTSGAGPKHRVSTDGSRVGKTSSNRNTHSSRDRHHRTSTGTRRSRDRQRTASNRDAPRNVNDSSTQPDANVQVELPTRELDNENDNADQSRILLGNENEGVPPRE